jgi:hypothetical protein
MNRLNEVEIRNFKKIRRAHLVLDGNTLTITGDNEAGKSSFLDGIVALFAGKDAAPKTPIRKGAKEAVVLGYLTDNEGRKLKATLTFGLPNSRRIVVVDVETGKPIASPQALLDTFWDKTSFDPSLFLVSKEADQLAMLRKMAGLDFAASDAEHARIFAERTVVNREVDRLRGVLSSQMAHPDAPASEESSASILAEIEAYRKHNDEVSALRTAVKDARDKVADAQKKHEDLLLAGAGIRDQIRELEAKLAANQKASEVQAGAVSDARKKLADASKISDVAEMKDTAPLTAKLSGLEDTNAKVRANVARAKTAADLKVKTAEAEKMTQRLEQIVEAKEEKIRNAKFPVDGLSLTETGVMFDGLPLEQASDSRKIAIGVEMAAAMNPDKPLMLVRHGNLFTGKNFAILEEIAAKRNLTVIVEIAGEKRADSRLHFQDGIGDDGSGIATEPDPVVEAAPEAPAPAPAESPAPAPKPSKSADLFDDLPPS